MLTGLALYRGPGRDFPGATAFVFGVVGLILLVFLWVYVIRPSRRRAAHRSGQRTSHHDESAAVRGGSYEHRAASRRRPNRH
jgi:flagellar biosynthesis/type III secretory pathway M-ring protein FliF/YscJ